MSKISFLKIENKKIIILLAIIYYSLKNQIIKYFKIINIILKTYVYPS